MNPPGLYSPWNSPGRNTGVGSLSLLQGIFPTLGLNLGLLHGRRILYQLSHKGSRFSEDLNKSITSQAPPNPLHIAWENRDPQRKSGQPRVTQHDPWHSWSESLGFWFLIQSLMDSLPSWPQPPRPIKSVKEWKGLKCHRIPWKWMLPSPRPKQKHTDTPGCKGVWDSRK